MPTSNHQTTKTDRFRPRAAGITFLAVICFHAVGGMRASSPPKAGLPGWAYHAGTDINPSATWWPDSGRRSSCEDWKSLADGRTEVPVMLAPSGSVFVVFRKPDAALDPIARDSFEISGVAQAGPNQLEIRIANLWANRFNADSLRPEAERFTRSNLDRIQTDPTSDRSFGQVPHGKTRPVYTELPPLMKSGLFGPVRILLPERRKREGS